MNRRTTCVLVAHEHHESWVLAVYDDPDRAQRVAERLNRWASRQNEKFSAWLKAESEAHIRFTDEESATHTDAVVITERAYERLLEWRETNRQPRSARYEHVSVEVHHIR